MLTRYCAIASLCLCLASLSHASDPLAGTALLTETRPLDEVMVSGIDRFALRELSRSLERRGAINNADGDLRQEFSQLIGVVDSRASATGIEFIATTTQPARIANLDQYTIHAVRWPVIDGITAEGLWLQPKGDPILRVVAIPDADWTPEMISGLVACESTFAADLASLGCEVLVPTLISRDHQFSGNPAIGRATNLTHREFIYRQAFEVGRHVIGYEVQKVLAAVDQFEHRNSLDKDLPIAVMGVSEGGLLALYSAAIDCRIDATVVSGYFDRRENIWQEPIYRNVWGLLSKFGDAELACMIAPRLLWLERSPSTPRVPGPPKADRNVAAPGTIQRLDPHSVDTEIARARKQWSNAANRRDSDWLQTLSQQADQPPLQADQVRMLVAKITGQPIKDHIIAGITLPDGVPIDSDARQQRQVMEMVDFTQRLLRESHRQREQRFSVVDRSSLDNWQDSVEPVRQGVHQELIGKLPDPTIAMHPRTRRIIDEQQYSGYEVMLDVYPDVIAAGVLLLPKGMTETEKRPVVVCQHGLEGTPMATIGGSDSKDFHYYKGISVELVRRGFIVYAPQNPYRGQDRFRTLQRKSNPLGRSLFSYIIPQHLVTLRWLATLPNVDRDRIGFYGLSYGGKTAMRVPPLLPPTETEPGYCLSICSADFNEWVSKNASVDAPFSYLWTGEYEIFEWNMAHVANYAELAMLMTPRPFMVERGHDDGVGIDEWVAWEYAKVRRHYNKLGIGDRTEIEFFDGPHAIHGQGTYRFLHQHLSWPPAE